MLPTRSSTECPPATLVCLRKAIKHTLIDPCDSLRSVTLHNLSEALHSIVQGFEPLSVVGP
jgi:hypothetical protein